MISILSWNIQYGLGIDGRVDLARIVERIHALGDHDVINLQEVSAGFEGPTGGADQYAQLARLLPGWQMLAPPSLQWFDSAGDDGGVVERRFGNALFTRLPVTEFIAHALPRPPDAEAPSMQRHLLEAIVMVGGQSLRVATTHLEYYSKVQRRAQVQRIRELEAQWTATIAAPPRAKRQGFFGSRPVALASILSGDFNFPVHEDSYSLMQRPVGDAQWLDPWSLVGDGAPHAPTCGVFDRKQWPDGAFACDFFFISKSLAARVTGLRTDVTTDASDHQPIVLTLDL